MSHFQKFALGSLFAFVLVAIPATSSASTVSDLQAQIASLLAQIQQLQSQLSGQGGGSTTTVHSSPDTCLQLHYNLSFGSTDASTGGDVSRLQQFLAQDSSAGYTAGVTGYFGPSTEIALQRYQAAHGIVSAGTADTTGYGAAGPSTRLMMAQQCTTNPPDKRDPLYPSPSPSATFSEGSLVTSSSRPTLTGTAYNVSSVTLAIKGYSGGSAHVQNNRWSITIADTLSSGTYSVELINDADNTVLATGTLTVNAQNAASADLKINGSDGPLVLADEDKITLSWTSSGASSCYLTNIRPTYGSGNTSVEHLAPSGSLVAYAAIFSNVGNVAVQCGQASDMVYISGKLASATIDKNSLTASTYGKDAALATLTGTASNVSELQISLDNVDGGPHVLHTNVTNGQWSVTFPAVFPGTHSVTVTDSDSGSSYAQTLATGTLTVNNPPGYVCATYNIPTCPVGQQVVTSSDTDAHGCPLPPKCVTKPIDCPVLQSMTCPVGQLAVTQTGTDSMNCPLPPVCKTSSQPDLVVGAVSNNPASFPASGFTITASTKAIPLYAPVTNQGGVSTGKAFTDIFYLSSSSNGAGAVNLNGTYDGPSAAGNTVKASVSHVFDTPGTYYIRVCADDSHAIAESNENNNCGPWTRITVLATLPPVATTASGDTNIANALSAIQSAIDAIRNTIAGR